MRMSGIHRCKCKQIPYFLQIWSHFTPEKCAVYITFRYGIKVVNTADKCIFILTLVGRQMFPSSSHLVMTKSRTHAIHEVVF